MDENQISSNPPLNHRPCHHHYNPPFRSVRIRHFTFVARKNLEGDIMQNSG